MFGYKIHQTISFLMIVCSSVVCCGQTLKSKPNFNRADSLRQDFVFFRNSIQNKYPSLYRYSDSTTMNHVFDRTYASINEKTSDLEFYKMIKILMGKIKDGHLYCGLPPTLEKYMDEKALFFPIKLRFVNSKVYTISDPQIPAGSEIVSIDKQPIDIVVSELFKYIVADGNIQTKKYHVLNNFFHFYYFIAFGETDHFDVTYKLSDGQLKSLRIKADLEKNIIGDRRSNLNEPSLDFSIASNHIALITIKTFDPSELKMDFSEFLRSTFKKINDLHIKKLIIDLRGNGGGRDTYGRMLYSYLAGKPFKYYHSLQTVTTDLEYEKFKNNVSSYNDLKPSMLKKVSNGQYRMEKEAHPNLQIQYPNSSYTGKVWFLIDGLSFSTTAEFCAIAYSNKRGDFIGEETGGTYDGNTSGVPTELILPNTKIEVSFGTVKYEMSVNGASEIGRGIIPKYKVQETIQDVINKKDSELAYAIWLADQKSN